MATRSSKRTRGGEVAAAAAAVVSDAAPAAAAAAAPAASPHAAAAAVPRTKSSKANAAAGTAVASASSAPAPASASSGSEWSLSGALGQLGGPAAPHDPQQAAAQLRTIQQIILKQANTRAADLQHRDLWPAFLSRLGRVQANTVRLDVHLLTAIGRTFAGAFAAHRAAASVAEDAFASLPTLQDIVQRLLPCAATPVAESWVSTFHPNYELLSGFLAGILRLLIGLGEGNAAPTESSLGAAVLGAQVGSLSPAVFHFVSSVVDAFTLVNLAQNSQKKIFEQSLQERNLPLWAAVHASIQRHLELRTAGADKVQREAQVSCALSIEHLISGALFHPEHLPLYAEVLASGQAGGQDDDDSEDEDEDEEEQAKREEEAKKQNLDSDAEQEGAPMPVDQDEQDAEAEEENKEDGEEEKAPSSKKPKLEPKSTDKKKTPAAAKGAPPTQSNYVVKLFESVQGWLSREEGASATAAAAVPAVGAENKKRKTPSAATPSVASTSTPSSAHSIPHVARAIRAALPLLFSSYLAASDQAFHALYPSASLGQEGSTEGASATLSGVEARRKKSREKNKGERELRFLQKMWAMNEHAPPLLALVSSESKDQQQHLLFPPLYAAPLLPETLPLFHHIFSTASRLFSLIARSNLYKVHQDANIGSAASASGGGAFQGVKKVLADQMHATMAVVRGLMMQQQQSVGAAVAVDEKDGGSKKSKKSSKLVATVSSSSSASASQCSIPDLLSLASPLCASILHLLALNPEFLLRYLYVKSTKESAASSTKLDKGVHSKEVNVWHLIWKVASLNASLDSSLVSPEAVLARGLSSPSSALRASRKLSQSICLAFSRLRQLDLLWHSSLAASVSLRGWDRDLPVVTLATVNGPAFDLASLVRTIPPLKVPAVWEWCLAQVRKHVDAVNEGSEDVDGILDSRSIENLLQLFVYFLDHMLVREESALALQKLYATTVATIVSGPLRASLSAAAGAGAGGKKSSVAQPLPLPSLLLLLHSLHDVKAQCDHHTTKTYETMSQPLPSFFADMGSEDDGTSEASTGSGELRLTNVISSLTSQSSAAPSPSLLYSLHLLALQRLHQIHAFQSRNIVTSLFAEDDENENNAEMKDGDAMEVDSDGDEIVRKPAASSSSRGNSALPKQSQSQESQALVSFILEQLDSTACYDAPSAVEHGAFAWDGSSLSLDASASDEHTRGAKASVALWRTVTGSMDVVVHFASGEQRKKIVQHLCAISACPWCHATADASAAQKAFASSSTALHTPRSLTSALLTQAWLYEIREFRDTLLDVSLAHVLQLGGALFKALDKTVRKNVAKTELPLGMAKIPSAATEGFELSAPHAETLESLVRFGAFSAGSSASPAAVSAGTLSSNNTLWEGVWMMQLLTSFPRQYLASSSPFHAALVQALWGIEACCASVASAPGQDDVEPKNLADLAHDVQGADAASMISHLHLAARRCMLSSFTSLAFAPAASSSAATSILSLLCPEFLQWTVFTSLSSSAAALRGRHALFAREATVALVHLLGPILARGANDKASKSDASSKVDEKQSKKPSKKDKSDSTSATAAATSGSSALAALIDPIFSSLRVSKKIPASALEWSLRLATSLVDSFVPGWSESSVAVGAGSGTSTRAEQLGRAWKTLVKDAPSVGELVSRFGSVLHEELIPGLDKLSSAKLEESVLALASRLVVASFAAKSSMSDKERAASKDSPAVGGSIVQDAEVLLPRAIKLLSTASASKEKDHDGALTFLHALAVSLPLFEKKDASISFSVVLRALANVSAVDAARRMESVSQGGSHTSLPSGSAWTATITAALTGLLGHPSTSAEELAMWVEGALGELDHSTLSADGSSMLLGDEVSSLSASARVSSSIQLLHVFLVHMHSSLQRRACTSSHLALLLYRLGMLSSRWVTDYSSGIASSSAAAAILASQTLNLLSHLLSRTQIFVVDDQSLHLISCILTNASAILREGFARSAREKKNLAAAAAALGSSVVPAYSLVPPPLSGSILYTPLYLSTHALLKGHPSAVIKIVPLFLSWVKILMEAQWRMIQHAEAGQQVPLSLSSNLSRLLSEFATPSRAKLFHPYAVGLLLDWISLSKHKGSAALNNSLMVEQHTRTIQQGLASVVNICQEHDLAQLHSLLDVQGRAAFRALHQAHKKAKFTGLV